MISKIQPTLYEIQEEIYGDGEQSISEINDDISKKHIEKEEALQVILKQK